MHTRFRQLMLVGVGVIALLFGPSSHAPAQQSDFRFFEAVADARGIQTEVLLKDFTAVGGADGSSTTAQATVDSLGNTSALAAAPFPGSTATENVGTVAGLLASQGITGLPAFPDVPTVVSSSAERPEHSLEIPGYQLRAESTERSSQGIVVVGPTTGSADAATSRSTAATTLDETGVLISESRNVVSGFTIAGVLEIGTVTTSARAELVPGEDAPTLRHKVEIDGADLLGFKIGLDGQDLVVLEERVPLGLNDALEQVPLGAVLEQLPADGLEINVLDAVEFDDGVLSGGIEIVYRASAFGPTIPTVGGVPAHEIRVVLGRALARANGQSAPTSSQATSPSGGSTPPVSPGSVSTPSGPASAGPTSGGSTPDVATGSAPDSGLNAAFTPADLTGALADPGTIASLYLIVVLGAIVGTLALFVFRRLGVRLGLTRNAW